MIRVKGAYTFCSRLQNMFLDTEIKVEHNNLITLLGESYFLNRWCNSEFNTINYVALGTGTRKAQKRDNGLVAETVRRQIQPVVDLNNKTVYFTVDFEASEIKDTTEIGVFCDDILVSRDVYTAINVENGLLADNTSTVNLTYTFGLETGSYRRDWTKHTGYEHVYSITEPNTVKSVIEENTGSGYVRRNSIQEVEENKASYYQQNNTKVLYIHTTTGETPESEDIIIKT